MTPTGRRLYSIDDVRALRAFLDGGSGKYMPTRRPGEPFAGDRSCEFQGWLRQDDHRGASRTISRAAWLPRAGGGSRSAGSLSALHGYQPEFDIGENETLFGALRYDEDRRPLADVIRPTYFPGLDLIPGNIELMEYEHETPRAMLAGRRAKASSLPVSPRRWRPSRAATMWW